MYGQNSVSANLPRILGEGAGEGRGVYIFYWHIFPGTEMYIYFPLAYFSWEGDEYIFSIGHIFPGKTVFMYIWVIFPRTGKMSKMCPFFLFF